MTATQGRKLPNHTQPFVFSREPFTEKSYPIQALATMTSSYHNGSQSEEHSSTSIARCNPQIYANCRIEDLPCYHEIATRNMAEILLLNNAQEGSFLIRQSTSSHGSFSVSVRLPNSVKHFHVDYNGQWYTFGQAQFWTPMELWIHLQNSPVLECEEGMVTRLTHPYLNEKRTSIPIPSSQYSVVTRQYEAGVDKTLTRREPTSNVVLSKEGRLFKKKEGKRWKRRWFILNQNCLSYKKNEKEKKTMKVLDLGTAIQVHVHHQNSRENCFRIVFSSNSYILSAESPEERDKWIKLIKWQIVAARQER